MRTRFEETTNQPEQRAAEWYAAYVKHHHETKTAELLERKGVEVFLPQQKVTHRWKDRNKILFLPLFPGYLFLQSSLEDKFQILSTPGVFFLVENGGRACPVSRQEIDSIRRIVYGGVEPQAHPYVTAGDRVRICAGPLAGVAGILTRFKNQYRVVLTVELLERALSIEVEMHNVEQIEESGSNCGSRAAELVKTS